MHALQHEMLVRFDLETPLLRWRAPGQEYDTTRPFLRDKIYAFLREALPPFAGVRVCVMSANGETCVQQ